MQEQFSIFKQPKRVWTSASVKAQTDGKWTVFTAADNDTPLNQPRARAPDCRIKYRHKRQEQPPPPPPPAPLEIPPVDNYTAFRVRKMLITSESQQPPNRRPATAYDIDMPQVNTSRLSGCKVHTARRKQVSQQEWKPPSRTQTGSTRRRRNEPPSLFERSLRPRDQSFEWPRDFQDFPANV